MASSQDSWSDLVPDVAKPVVYAYKYRKHIQDYWKRALVKAGMGSPNVIITGRSGTGKSVLASHYHGEANNLDWSEPGPSPDIEVKPISIGDWTEIVIVIPGQNSAERARALDGSLNKTKDLDGVIHVVDWGYTAIRDSAIRNEMIARSGIDSIEKVRAENLRLELRDFELMLEKISMSIANGRGPKWVVIAVNKIDLYESEMEDAKNYYHPLCSGDFSKIIKEFYEKVGSNNVKLECLPVCSMPEPFEWNGEVSKSEIDSVTRQRNYLRAFIERVSVLQGSV